MKTIENYRSGVCPNCQSEDTWGSGLTWCLDPYRALAVWTCNTCKSEWSERYNTEFPVEQNLLEKNK